MDLVLRVCDNLFLDKLWAILVPISAFAPLTGPAQLSNASVILPLATAETSWSHVVSFLPHPPFAHELTVYSSRAVSAWPRDYVPRQLISLIIMTVIGIHVLYFLFAGLSYIFIFNHEMMKHPRFLKNQVKLEIQTSLRSFPGMTLLTLPWFQAEVMGYSKLYDGIDTYGYFYLFASIPLWVSITSLPFDH
jgi:lathosterol oxidase